MTHRVLKIRLLLSLFVSAALAACASSPRDNEPDIYGMLYDGESTAAYATAFPVDSPEEAYRNGDLSARAGDFDRALFEYIRGLRLEEEPVADPLFRIGSIHHQRGNHQLAEMAYAWALEVDPDNGAAGTGLGTLLLEARQYEAAEKQLRSVVRAGNATWRTHNALGILMDLRGRFEAAGRHYRLALETSPQSYVVLNNLGYSRYLAGDREGAHDALASALRVNSHYELAWRNLGLVHARDGNYDEALDAVARSGTRAEAYNDIGYLSMLNGQYADAEYFFREAMRLSPTYYVTASENAAHLERRMRRNAASQR